MITRKLSLTAVAAVVGLTVLAVAGANANSLMTWWHNFSQASRNARIVDRAEDELGDNVHLSCKEWVRDVVRDASHNEVTIPPNSSNNTRWQSHSYCHRYAAPVSTSNFRVGHIIQMRWRNQNGTIYPHTAIILSRTSSGMNWIDSNWQGDQTVRTRYVSFAQFNQAVGTNYSVYKIE